MNNTEALAWERPATSPEAAPAAAPASAVLPGVAAAPGPAWRGLLLPAAGLLALAALAFALPLAFAVMVPAVVLAGWGGWWLGSRHGNEPAEPEAGQAEASGAQADAMMQALAECSEHAVMAKDLDGRYVVFNRAAQRFAGSRPQAGVGEDAKTLFGPARGARMQAMDRRIVATGLTERCLQEVDTPDGRVTYHVTKGPLRDAQGQVLGVYGIAQDVTRQHAEQALLHQLLHAAELCTQRIVVTTLDAVVVYANAAALAAAGCTREQMLGSNWRHTLAQASPDAAGDTVWARLRAGHSWRGQFGSTGPHGQARLTQAVISPLMSAQGQVTHVVALLHDLTEQQRGVHDLAQQRQHLEALLAQCRAERVQGSDPAGATRPDQAASAGPAGPVGAAPAHEPFALRALLAGGCDALRPLAAAQQVQIQWHADADLPDTLLGDQQRLRTLLHTLVGTAIRTCAGLQRPGLALVRGQVEALGGSVDVYSVREAGTVYALDLPLPTARSTAAR